MRTLILIILLLLQLRATTQENANPAFTTTNGLPDNNVTCMLTDKQGFIWLGTSNGLCRFDGTHFFTLPKGTVESTNLAGDIFLDLEEDGDYIWAAHHFGVSRINKYSFECTNFQSNETGPRYVNQRVVRDIYKDKFDNIWLAGSQQLLQFNRKTNAIMIMADLEKFFPGSKDRQIIKIVPNGLDGLLLCFSNKWVQYNISKNTINSQVIDAIPVTLLKGENIRLRSYWNTFSSMTYVSLVNEKKSISFSYTPTPSGVAMAINLYVDSNLNILVNQEQNLQSILKNEEPEVPYTSNTYNGLTEHLEPFNFVQYRKGIACWGSTDGLHIVGRHLKYLRRYFIKNNTKDLLTTVPNILDVKEYSNSEWLIATTRGLYRMDKVNSGVTSFSRWQDSVIYKILLLPDSSVWLSTSYNLWHFNLKTNLTEKPIALETYAVSIIALPNKLIVSTRSNGLLSINLNTRQLTTIKQSDTNRQISSNRITAIKQVPGSENFIITYNNLPGQYSYTNFETGYYKTDSIPLASYVLHEKFSIESVLPTAKQLWFGSNLGGVHLYDSIAKLWTNFTTKDGLGNNTVFEILPDNQKRIWLLTDNGMDVYDNHSRLIYNLPVELVTGGKKGGFINSSGNLVFFDSKNIYEIKLSAFDLNTPNSKILLSQISQGDTQFSLREYTLTLPYDKNSFVISFSLQKLDPSIDTRYAYRLSTTDNWKLIGTQTQLNFASLEPGSYQLQIKATDEFGQWKNNSAPFPIVINPPFWKTWWFFLLVSFACMVSVWTIFTVTQKRKLKAIYQQNEIIRLKTAQELIVAKERERITADLHDDVGANLSSIRILADLITKDTQRGATLFADKISNIAIATSQQMNTIIWALNSDNDSVLNFCEYVRQYAVQFLDRSNITMDYTQHLETKQYPITGDTRKNLFLSIKEVLHNAVKYAKCSLIHISITQSGKNIAIAIVDNGIGIVQQNQFGNGIKNIHKRLAQQNGTANFENENGLKVTFRCSI